GASNAQPDYYTQVNLGAIAAGQRFQATVWAKGTVITGQNVLAVSWFSAGGVYLGNSTSPSVPLGTSGWNQLTVKAVAPAGAAYAQIHLQSYRNSGTVWFDDA